MPYWPAPVTLVSAAVTVLPSLKWIPSRKVLLTVTPASVTWFTFAERDAIGGEDVAHRGVADRHGMAGVTSAHPLSMTLWSSGDMEGSAGSGCGGGRTWRGATTVGLSRICAFAAVSSVRHSAAPVAAKRRNKSQVHRRRLFTKRSHAEYSSRERQRAVDPTGVC